MDPLANLLPVTEAALKYGVDLKRLRGAVFMNRLHDPIGDFQLDLVQDDEVLERWVAKQKAVQRG